MEHFLKLAKDLESTVTTDLDRIQEMAPECSEFTDNIRINLAGQISSMVALIDERGRTQPVKQVPFCRSGATSECLGLHIGRHQAPKHHPGLGQIRGSLGKCASVEYHQE